MQFLPETLTGWVSVVVQLVVAITGAIAYVSRFIRKPLEDQLAAHREKNDEQFRNQGERIGRVENGCTTNAAKVDSTDRQVERLHLQFTSMAEQQGRWDERFTRLMDKMEEAGSERIREDREISDRLARIETKMEIFDQLNDALVALARRGT